MKRAKASVAAYNKKVKAAQDENERISAAYAPAFAQCAQYSYVNCPDPDYAEFPDAPDVDDEVKQLTTVANSMTSLKAELVGIQRPVIWRPPTPSCRAPWRSWDRTPRRTSRS